MSKRKPYTLEHTKEARRVIKALREALYRALNETTCFYEGLDDDHEGLAWRENSWDVLDMTRNIEKEVF
ncbi:MAG: hypothetical protein ACREOP_06300 [Thermodesulfobacteriota bacterium]